MNEETSKITLQGGPCNGQRVEDQGNDPMHMSIASEYEYGSTTPTDGAKVGMAIYEPSEDRTEAFWLSNKWQGRFAKQ